MGIEKIVALSGSPPSWLDLQREIAQAGLQVKLKMIDGLPAFPDEIPDEGWHELRVGSAGGMITLRLAPGQLSIAVWGNADENLRREWEMVALACAAAAQRTIQPLPDSD